VGILPAKELLQSFEDCIVFQLDAEVIYNMIKIGLVIRGRARMTVPCREKVTVEYAGCAMVDK